MWVWTETWGTTSWGLEVMQPWDGWKIWPHCVLGTTFPLVISIPQDMNAIDSIGLGLRSPVLKYSLLQHHLVSSTISHFGLYCTTNNTCKLDWSNLEQHTHIWNPQRQNQSLCYASGLTELAHTFGNHMENKQRQQLDCLGRWSGVWRMAIS